MIKQCPKCETEMMRRNIGAVEIDECNKCGGVWFDNDELRHAKDATDSDLNWMDFEIWKHADQFKAKPSMLKCPVCKTPTKTIQYGTTHFEIDYCPNCRGTWLGKGEFEKIIDALEKELLTTSFSQYVRDAVQEAKEVFTGPESLISEWKDFATVLRLMQYRLFVENPKLMDAVTAAQKASPFR
jgi:Zn-finger nucleic acid-binding protein